MKLRFLSLFSGIEAASQAWLPLGWECAAVAEIEPFPCAVLAHHYPDVPNLGDVTKITEADIVALGPIDVLIFGSPCQDLSVAGNRAGLAGARSGLFFTAVQIMHWLRKHNPGFRFALWENVYGAFSSNKGRDFAAVVGALSGCDDIAVPANGWGNEGVALGLDRIVEWGTLDAQWFGVAQRRRRVFALVDFGDWASRCPILIESESLRGNTAPRRETGQSVAGTLESRPSGGGFPGTDGACAGHVVARRVDVETYAIQERAVCENPDAGPDGAGFRTGTAYTLEARSSVQAVAFGGNNCSGPIAASAAPNSHGGPMGRMDFESETFVVALPLTSRVDRGGAHREAEGNNMVVAEYGVRRLTPPECEKLQGFPVGYTLVPVRSKPAADGPRYKGLGNSMAVPVIRWIGEQIELAYMQ